MLNAIFSFSSDSGQYIAKQMTLGQLSTAWTKSSDFTSPEHTKVYVISCDEDVKSKCIIEQMNH